MSREQLAVGVASALNSLRDIAGVHGSFVVSQTGELIGKDLPSVFDEHVFAEVGPRIVRLRETFGSVGDDMDGCLLRYSEHKLFLKAMNEGTVGVLLTLAANMPALKMAVSLAVRRMSADVTAYHRTPAELPLPTLPAATTTVPPGAMIGAASTPPPAPSQSVRPRGRMVFRGHEVK